ncbi:MAG: squalene synthase HpnC [Chloroflexota bacterium]|nr:squalene synthase HpnC [Chloroflexota bacterium]MDE2941950.1 squalene synthase HpnC [Chloroflexota bacterium]MDE3268613.1 squalene synthase HpnC [Chloroflexota bacterium]
MDGLTASSRTRWSAEEAYDYCRTLARSHYENFTVASWFLPRDKRPHVYAVYAFCRFVDDLGDEAQGDRLALLDRWEEELRACYDGMPTHPIAVALADTIQRFSIPMEPFLKLVEANRIDQRTQRHPTYDDLLFYCDHSANPVGRLFLYLFGYWDAERQRLSDATCTALQLANFWQDVRRDLEMGRIYIPQEDMVQFGCTEKQLHEGVADSAFRELMRFEVERARGLFREGAALVDAVEGIVRLDIALFTEGGLHILNAIERQDYDVLSRRPTLSKLARTRLAAGTAIRMKLRGRI